MSNTVLFGFVGGGFFVLFCFFSFLNEEREGYRILDIPFQHS